MTLRNLNDGNNQLNDKLLDVKGRLGRLAEELVGPRPPLPSQGQLSTLAPPMPTPPFVIDQITSTMTANHDACDSIMDLVRWLEDQLSLSDKLAGSVSAHK